MDDSSLGLGASIRKRLKDKQEKKKQRKEERKKNSDKKQQKNKRPNWKTHHILMATAIIYVLVKG